MEERRQGMHALEQRIGAVETAVRDIQGQMETLREIRDILAEGRTAFKFAGRVAHGLTWTARAAALVVLPGLVVAAGLYALTHQGAPPPWLEQWVNIVRGK